jgi:hypothetical protein
LSSKAILGRDVFDAFLDAALVGLKEFHQGLQLPHLGFQELDIGGIPVDLFFQREQLLLEDLDVLIDELVGLFAPVLAEAQRAEQDKREDPRQALGHEKPLIFR